MERPEVLLAKRPIDPQHPRREETLVGHTEAVMQSFRLMFGERDAPTRLTNEWFRFFRLSLDDDLERFWVHGVLACGLHDVGKANSGFQQAVIGERGAQLIYHEHLSGLIIGLPEIWDWLSSIQEIDPRIVLSAVISHHLRAQHKDFGATLNPDRCRFSVYSGGVLEAMHLEPLASLAKECDPQGIPDHWSLKSSFFLSLRMNTKKTLNRFDRAVRHDEGLRRLLLSVRSALIAADSAGSGLTREDKVLQDYLGIAFSENEIQDDRCIREKVIMPRIKQITKAAQCEFRWLPFQEAAESLPERAVLLSPCGSGKTLAAWRWIEARLKERSRSRVIFLYPTRATASEGFRDYVSWAPEADAALMHGTSDFELEGMFENPEDQQDERSQKDFTTEDRLFAVGYWQRRIFSATVDQFLGFMQYTYRSICLLPMLVDSVVVIDEVHSFDKSLFSALKRFLQFFDVPVLCMTASLPPKRQEYLVDCGLSVFPREKDQSHFYRLKEMAEMSRYAVACCGGEGDAEAIAAEAFRNGKRVLWVVNTVERCQRIARRLNALCYHSRFKLMDRNSRHQEVIHAFKQQDVPVLAVTTQVCEMSLDLDADVLITEAAPITSLIQRMGRCNRHAKPDENKIGNVFIYQAEGERPYSKDDLKGVDAFLDAVDGKQISQARLRELLEECGSSEVEPERYAAFLESGSWAKSREEKLRDIQDFTVQAVLDLDLNSFLRLRHEHKPTDGFILPVPRRDARRDPRLGRFPLVASSAHYSTQYGFSSKLMEDTR